MATPAYKTKKFWATTTLTLMGLLLTSGVALPAIALKGIGGLTAVLALLGFRVPTVEPVVEDVKE